MKTLFVLLLTFFAFVKLQAQNYASASGSIIVSPIFSFSISNPSANLILTTIDEVKNGKTVTNFSSISVKSNKSWQLSVKSASATFSLLSSLDPGVLMPADKLKIRKANTSTFLALSTTAQVLATGTKGNATVPGNSFSTDVRFSPGLTHKGGIYSIALVYTLSQP